MEAEQPGYKHSPKRNIGVGDGCLTQCAITLASKTKFQNFAFIKMVLLRGKIILNRTKEVSSDGAFVNNENKAKQHRHHQNNHNNNKTRSDFW